VRQKDELLINTYLI